MEPDRSSSTKLITSPGEAFLVAPSAASLVLIYGGNLGTSHPLKGELILGREEGCTIPLANDEVSRRHARLYEVEGSWWLEDLGSTNGTLVNGVELQEPRRLVNGDLLKLGGVILKFLEGGNLEALYFEEIHRLTLLDGLTGVPNKRCLMEFLVRESARAQRYRRPLSVVMIDVDHFKQVNDAYGHLVGDLVLQQLARTASAMNRMEDLFARFGGEEFALVLPETELAQAVVFCERLRGAVEQSPLPLEGGCCRITISLGLAQLEEGMELKDLLAEADAQLYRAKSAGRNRTMSILNA